MLFTLYKYSFFLTFLTNFYECMCGDSSTHTVGHITHF